MTTENTQGDAKLPRDPADHVLWGRDKGLATALLVVAVALHRAGSVDIRTLIRMVENTLVAPSAKGLQKGEPAERMLRFWIGMLEDAVAADTVKPARPEGDGHAP